MLSYPWPGRGRLATPGFGVIAATSGGIFTTSIPAPASVAYPALDLSLTRDQAVIELVTAYFDRYGPATLRDATWWSGLSVADITTALLACGRPLAAVATPWSEDPCLMFADPAAESADSEVTTGVQFLAHEDTALKAYSQTRSRYLGGLPQRQAFNQIGEALPTVVIDGMVVGSWSWDTRTASVLAELIPGRVPPAGPAPGKGPRRRTDRDAPLGMGTPAAVTARPQPAKPRLFAAVSCEQDGGGVAGC